MNQSDTAHRQPTHTETKHGLRHTRRLATAAIALSTIALTGTLVLAHEANAADPAGCPGDPARHGLYQLTPNTGQTINIDQGAYAVVLVGSSGDVVVDVEPGDTIPTLWAWEAVVCYDTEAEETCIDNTTGEPYDRWTYIYTGPATGSTAAGFSPCGPLRIAAPAAATATAARADHPVIVETSAPAPAPLGYLLAAEQRAAD